ncbi:hypothetical protein Ciccas_010918, partial [Cichlidogyrus casuarinus]
PVGNYGGVVPPPLPPHQNQVTTVQTSAHHPHFAHHLPGSRPMSNLFDSHPNYLSSQNSSTNGNYLVSHGGATFFKDTNTSPSNNMYPNFPNAQPQQKHLNSVLYSTARQLSSSERRKSMLF